MLRHCATLLTFLFLLASTGQAAVILTANLTNDQENPPVTPTLRTGGPACTPPSPVDCTLRAVSFGTAIFEINDDATAMTFSATVFNIDFTGTQSPDTNDNLTAGHIHAGPNAVPGINAGVVWGFFGTPFNDNNPNDVVITPFATGVGASISGKWDAPEGNGTTLAAQLPFILSDRSYINFHTVQFGGGEVRGQIINGSLPEPSTALLLGLGALFLVGCASRSRRRI